MAGTGLFGWWRARADERQVFRPADFGAKGDGLADDTEALRAAQARASEVGGVVEYDGVYRVTSRITLNSHVTHRGVSAEATIRNDSPFDPKRPVDRECFSLGEYTTEMLSRFPAAPLKAAARGEQTLALGNAALPWRPQPGDFAIVATRERLTTLHGTRLPVRQQLVKIIAVDMAAGRLDIQHPLTADFPEADLLQLHAFNGFSRQPAHCVEDVRIQRLRFEGGGISFGAAYDCAFENLTFADVRDLVFGNCLAHSRLEGISGTFWNRGCEIKLGTHDSTVSDLDMTYVPSDQPAYNGWISLGEMARNVTMSNVRLDASRYTKDGGVILVGLQYCFGIRIDGLDVKAPGLRDAVGILLMSGKSEASAPVDCDIRNADVACAHFARCLQWGSGGRDGPMNCTLGQVRFHGAADDDAAVFEAGRGNVIRDVNFGSGRVVSGPDFTGNELDNIVCAGVDDSASLSAHNTVRSIVTLSRQ
ncbi:glycoside hydrolase family 55 protein [Ancylobacter mangrovi]|uniref:glycoside hydrolase family 55 protein n=1 Tax=Ancylobacter mangrovi TaxID=2972472 RepID=UPI002163935B|nr:glycoside hydrolase family 55 protein [Ancylobacter mangrovi]MCS0504867.1 glycoside hydrolase family 55 protein [Ancylobacter mangrovi]